MSARFPSVTVWLAGAFAILLGVCLHLGRKGGLPVEVERASTPAKRAERRVSSLGTAARKTGGEKVAQDAPKRREGTPSSSGKFPPNDPTLVSMRPAMRFAGRVRAAREWSVSRQVSEGRRLLKARAAEDRALGGILLFLNGELDWDASAAVAKDENLLVPLAVFDWIRDLGTEEEAAAFASALKARDIPDDELVAWLETSAGLFAGGRSALDLLLGHHDEETVANALEPVILAPGVAYDVREEALFKLLEPENKKTGLELLEKLVSEERDGDSLLAQSLAKWTSLAHLSDDEDEEVPYKVWDTPLRELSHLAESDLGLAVRTLANYLEYGLHRDDSDFEPVVEEGAYDIAKAFLDRARAEAESLLPEEANALDRLATSVERLVSYDPAFVTDENEFSEDFDEEIDVEILDEEDAYLADLLAADDEDDEDDEDDGDDGDEDDGDEDDGDDGDDADDADDEDDGNDEDDADDADDGDGLIPTQRSGEAEKQRVLETP